jgi:hypothetical protein
LRGPPEPVAAEGEAAHRQQGLYFNELFQLKVACEYTRRYRNRLGKWVTRLSILRAVASSGAIATWAVVQSYPLIWGTIIAAAQLADVLRDAIPLTARYKATSALVMSLDALFIEALFEWEAIFAGQLSNDEISERWRKLMQALLDAQKEQFPDGDLPERQELMALAEQDAISYFESRFGPEE